MAGWKQSSIQVVNRFLNRFGLQISRFGDTSLQAAFERLSRRPVAVNTVIDIGASDGRWSEKIRRYYPAAYYMLVDVNPIHKAALDQFKHRYPNSDYLIAAAGNEDGTGNFAFGDDPLGGVVTAGAWQGTVEVPMAKIDTLVSQRVLQPPFLIKLDTHGYEVPILEGAASALSQTNMIVMETYNFQILPNSLRFYEMCGYMEARGFRPVDIIEPDHRPRDGALWQFDLLFIRSDRPEFAIGSFT